MESKMILYPTDFSVCADNALDYAVALAKALELGIKTVHFLDAGETVRFYENPSRATNKFELLEVKTTRKIKSRNKEILDKDIPCDYEILKTNRFSWLTNFVRQQQPELVVMGTQGNQVVRNKIMGKETFKVIRNCNFPTLAVPRLAIYKDIKRIIFATDCHKSDGRNLEFIIRIAEHFGASVDVVHISDKNFDEYAPSDNIDGLKDKMLKKVGYRDINFRLFNATNVAEHLDVLAKESGADLVALVCRKRRFFDRLFGKSLTKRMVYHTHTPMLIF